MDERRSSQRFPLDSLYFVQIRFENSEPATCMVLNLSRGGALLNLPSTLTQPLPTVNTTFEVMSSPEIFNGVLEGHIGRIVWIKDTMCGISFDKPLAREWEDGMAASEDAG